MRNSAFGGKFTLREAGALGDRILRRLAQQQQRDLTAVGRMAIGSRLRTIYDHDQTEPLPRRLAELLRALEAQDEAAGLSSENSDTGKREGGE